MPIKYPEQWALVDSLEAQGLPQSALEQTKIIADAARAEQNPVQLVKAILNQAKYVQQLDEDGAVKAIALLEKESEAATLPAQAVLQSALAGRYVQYLQGNRWSIAQRTPIPDGEGGDLRTWSAAQLEKKAIELYLKSVQSADQLYQAKASDWAELLTKSQHDTLDNKPLRPTLLDILAQEAFTHLRRESSYLTEPAYAFVLDQKEAFDGPQAFATYNFESKDLNSGKWRTLQLFQQLTAQHLKNGNRGSLLDLTLQRLDFALDNSNRSDRNARYEAALAQLLPQWKDSEGYADILFSQANHWKKQSDQTQPNGSSEMLKKAVGACDAAQAAYPNSFGAQRCTAIKEAIVRPSVQINVERSVVPDEAILLSVIFKNTDKAYYRVVSINGQYEGPNERYEYNARVGDLLNAPIIVEGTLPLRDTKDYLEHRTEQMLKGLPAGRYALLISQNGSFDTPENVADYAFIQSTQMAAIYMADHQRSTAEIWLVNRQTGAGMPGVTATVTASTWDRDSRPYAKVINTLTTDAAGKVTINASEQSNIYIKFKSGDDVFVSDYVYVYKSEPPVERSPTIEFFTDRGIYRPGQTVYFKGILLNRDAKEKPSIVPNHNLRVVLMDANGQERGSLNLRSNEYGTVNGTFVLPLGGLTGGFYLQPTEGADGSGYIQVEEYKRPRFEVKFDDLAGTYKLNETVTVSGKAMDYTGVPTDGAAVTWRVVRRSWMPYWGFRWGGYFDPQTQEIASGTAATDANGQFEVKFKALPNDKPEDEYPPAFEYEITADVTDGSGETRSGSTAVKVGKNALSVGLELKEKVVLEDLKKVEVLTSNLSDKKVAAKGTITLQRLDAPRKVFKNRLFPAPDLNVMDEPTFRTHFPDYAWNGEDEPKNWRPTGTALSYTFDTGNSTAVDLSKGGIQPGHYRVTAEAKDASGGTVRFEQTIEVRATATDFVAPDVFSPKSTVQPGETADISLGSAFAPMHALVIWHRMHEAPAHERVSINGVAAYKKTVSEKDRGGMGMHWITIYHNRIYQGQFNWAVPFSNKELNIQFETFRDILQPGSKEEWRLRISGPKKEKVAAEVVAAMYDASLDQFMDFKWNFAPYYTSEYFEPPIGMGFNGVAGQNGRGRYYPYYVPGRVYPRLTDYGYFNLYSTSLMGNAMRKAMPVSAPGGAAPEAEEMMMAAPPASASAVMDIKYETVSANAIVTDQKDKATQPPPAQIRKNLQETVFFYPELRTDANGDVLLKFTMNEALTQWKLQVMAHTKDLQYALSEKTVVTQKELMITANAPRFFRAGDELEFAAKINNLTGTATTGTASLALMDAATLQPLEQQLGLVKADQPFSVEGKQSTAVRWKISIPQDFTGAVTWRVFAESKAGRDGEENTLPVVTNRQLVTESLPLAVRGQQDKTFSFPVLEPSSSRTMHHFALEFTSNPAWYAVQSMPYIMEYPHQCSEQVFSRFYVNTLAQSVTEKMPTIRRVYDRWKGTKAMESNLSKNQELKQALLEETPWVLDAQQEAQQKQNIGLLFDLNRMAGERERAMSTLLERQSSAGGWPWFPGAQDSWYITQYILTGLAHLEKLGALKPSEDPNTAVIMENGMRFCDNQLERAYNDLEQLVKDGKAKWEDDHLDGLLIQYLYFKSFYPGFTETQAFSYYKKQIRKYWTSKNLQQQGMLALIEHRIGDKTVAQSIVRSLKERAQIKDELGMYWSNTWGFYWYELRTETQALMIEVFNEVTNDREAVDNMRIWLLKNKQTNRWESTKATAEAIYSLLLTGDNWLNETKPVQVSLGSQRIAPQETEAGSGYFKQDWNGTEVKADWNTVTVKNPNSTIAWGAAYRQYFEDLDKIKGINNTGLTVVRSIYRQKNSDTGPVLEPIKANDAIQVGDQLKIRLEVRCDRPMEFVHLKDMRPSGCEPRNVLSGYRYAGGLGYYESTRDLATHFFIDYLPQGTYVLEYPLVATHKGNMSLGIATLQCMYAPEFSAHSQGIRIKIE